MLTMQPEFNNAVRAMAPVTLSYHTRIFLRTRFQDDSSIGKCSAFHRVFTRNPCGWFLLPWDVATIDKGGARHWARPPETLAGRSTANTDCCREEPIRWTHRAERKASGWPPFNWTVLPL